MEELTDAYQLYLETASEYEGQLRANAGRQPESPMELQTALATLMELKPKIEMANDDLHRLATEYKRTIETISGSTGSVIISSYPSLLITNAFTMICLPVASNIAFVSNIVIVLADNPTHTQLVGYIFNFSFTIEKLS